AELDLSDAGADEITDVVSCPGTDSCKLGITSSMGLNQVLQERLEEMAIDDPLTKRIHIKMSGCPNGCSQHHVANIGFYGASIKVGERTIPAYIAHVGGNASGATRFGHRLKARLPAKRVPEAVERWLRFYEAERSGEEAFHPRLRFALSFQKTSSVIVDIAHRVNPSARFFYLDTELLFPETYETRDVLAERYGIELERYSGISLEAQEDLHGANLWRRDP